MTAWHNDPISPERANALLALPLEDKVLTSWEKIDQWYTAWGGKCYVSFSGGKDSTVLAYLVARYLASYRTPPWPLNLVFVNTGLEYPEIQHFVDDYAVWLSQEFPHIEVNLARLRPKMNIRQVVAKYGYSIVSKEVAGVVYETRKNPNCVRAKKLRGELLDKEGKPSAYNCDNWAFLLDAPFPISDRCCHVMKKASAHRYDGETKEKPIVATMATEGRQRMSKWRASGCNAFDGKRPMGKPMSFWSEQDVLHYLVGAEIPYCSVYGDIVASDGENEYTSTLTEQPLRCTGCQRTGCMFCGFGAHLEKGENRFQRMKRTHPRHYDFCIGGGAFDPTDGLWKPTAKGAGVRQSAGFYWGGL